MSVPLIPRDTFFGNPEKLAPRISPDGRRLLYIAPHEGVLNAWVRDVAGGGDRPVTSDKGRGVLFATWSPDSRQVLAFRDRDGDENYHAFGVPLDGGPERDLTPFPGARVGGLHTRPGSEEILIGLNNRDPKLFDMHRLNLRTGELTLDTRNDIGANRLIPDTQLRVRVANVPLPDGGFRILHRPAGGGEWTELQRWGPEDATATSAIAFTGDDRTLLMSTSIGSDCSQLRALDTTTGEERILAAQDGADFANLLVHPTTYQPQAVSFAAERQTWTALNPEVASDFEALRAHHPGEISVVSQTEDDRVWVVAWSHDRGSDFYGIWDRTARRVTPLFSARPSIDHLPLAEMSPVTIAARDGITLHGYLTLPVGTPPQNLPAVVLVHGGPWVRDTWGYRADVQWLANRGYAVLQVNYRGSTGYGKSFVRASFKEWGGRMQDDIADAALWLSQKGISDPRRTAIMGGSYGGYATLSGLVRHPELWACGLAMCGPSNLFTFLNSIPPYWEAMRSLMYLRIGHPVENEELLRERSPFFHADKIRVPLLVAQGANDPRVKKAESLQIVETMRARGKDVDYIEFANEGHGFVRPENRLSYFAAAERFLARHIGGRCET